MMRVVWVPEKCFVYYSSQFYLPKIFTALLWLSLFRPSCYDDSTFYLGFRFLKESLFILIRIYIFCVRISEPRVISKYCTLCFWTIFKSFLTVQASVSLSLNDMKRVLDCLVPLLFYLFIYLLDLLRSVLELDSPRVTHIDVDC